MTTPKMQIQHWQYYHGQPNISGTIKSQAEDFQVREILSVEPLGEGEHVYLWIRKIGLNTAFLAEQLAKFAGVPLRCVSYAGRKDKHASTEQWFSIHLPGKEEPNWQSFNLDGATILKADRHHKKLRPGNLDCNFFSITVRNLSSTQGLEDKLKAISTLGVPNYYGTQRFGEIRTSENGTTANSVGGNLDLASRMLEGETIRNRNKRSMAISALRSWLFNEFVDQRLTHMRTHHLNEKHAIAGDVLILSGSNSFFNCDTPDAMIQNRLKEQDIQLSAPLWGKGDLDSSDGALALEQSIAAAYPEQCRLLEELGLKQERRAIWLYPLKMRWQLDGDTLKLEFFLFPGCFATSVLRELVNT